MCHFDVDNGSFMCDINTLIWLSGTSDVGFKHLFLKKRKYDSI